MSNERTAQLAAVKLRALVGDHLSVDPSQVAPARPLGAGASLVQGAEHGELWAYFVEAERASLTIALLLAVTEGAQGANIIVDDADVAQAMAWSAGAFTVEVNVWVADGRTISRVETIRPQIEPAPACAELTAELARAGLEIVADHGVWIGEINGLEVARVGERDGECAIDIGVGAHDQFASAALDDTDAPVAEMLDKVVSQVRPYRTAGAPPHAIGRMARARWLRAQAMQTPGAVGLSALDPIPLVTAKPGLLENQVAAGLGSIGDNNVLVVFAVGIDVSMVETAASLSQLHDVTHVLLVVPPRDHHRRLDVLAACLRLEAEVVTLVPEWLD